MQGSRFRWSGVVIGALMAASASAQQARPVDRATFEGWIDELSNWGRWGGDDELGTLNFITPEKRRAAAALVEDGVSVSLAHDALSEEAPDNGNPYRHRMLLSGESQGPWAVDDLAVTFHGYAHSHMDAVCHRFHDGKLYNGFPRSAVDAEGCGKLAIPVAKNGIFSRAVLMDIPRLKGVSWLEPGEAIYAEDLEAWEARAGVRVTEGDVLLLRTGRWTRRAEKGAWNLVEEGSAGLHASAVAWLRQRGVAMLGSDVAADVFPSGVEGYTHPVHLLVLVALGMPIFDNLDLEAVSEAAAERGRWAFLLTAAPIPVPGGTGSPLNPIATF